MKKKQRMAVEENKWSSGGDWVDGIEFSLEQRAFRRGGYGVCLAKLGELGECRVSLSLCDLGKLEELSSVEAQQASHRERVLLAESHCTRVKHSTAQHSTWECTRAIIDHRLVCRGDLVIDARPAADM